jgi:hypothetical protein
MQSVCCFGGLPVMKLQRRRRKRLELREARQAVLTAQVSSGILQQV